MGLINIVKIIFTLNNTDGEIREKNFPNIYKGF